MKQVTFTAVNAVPQNVEMVRYRAVRGQLQYQVDITTFTGVTVKLHGRLSPDLPWRVIATINADGLATIDNYPFVGVSLDAATASATPATDKVVISLAEA